MHVFPCVFHFSVTLRITVGTQAVGTASQLKLAKIHQILIFYRILGVCKSVDHFWMFPQIKQGISSCFQSGKHSVHVCNIEFHCENLLKSYTNSAMNIVIYQDDRENAARNRGKNQNYQNSIYSFVFYLIKSYTTKYLGRRTTGR